MTDRLKLKVLGTAVTLVEPIRARAEQDLGLDIEFHVVDGVSAQQKAVTQPDSFDIYDQWFHSAELLWGGGVIQPVDVRRIDCWPEVNDLTREGRLSPDARLGMGDAPNRRLFVQPDGSLGSRPTERLSMLPVVHNVDSFGYCTDVVPPGEPYRTESWGWLLDDRWRGRVALVGDPTIGVMDAALAAQAQGLAQFHDISNMSVEEIDRLVKVLIKKKAAGHFRAFWSTLREADELMASGEVALSSMWSPTVSSLRARGVPVRYASPVEGYRAWHGGLCLSARLTGAKLDAAYAYLNWWLDGWAGAVMARQGYYISVPERVKQHLSPAEWAYWYLGEPASTQLTGPGGEVVAEVGERRDGGSYWERLSRVAVWNSVMDEHNYLVRRWSGFLAA